MRLAPFAGPDAAPEDAARTDVALLLHGFGADRLSWLANAPALAGAAHVLAPDLPGHGATAASGDGGFETVLGTAREALAGVLRERESGGLATRLHLVGHSLGGAVAIALAADETLPVATLVAIAPAGLGTGIDVDWLRALVALEDETEALAHLGRLVADPRMVSRQAAGALLAHLGRDGARAALDALARDLDGLEARLAPAVDAVAARSVARACVWGERDAVNPPDEDRIAALGGESVRFERAGHLPHVERAGRFNRLALGLIEAAASDAG